MRTPTSLLNRTGAAIGGRPTRRPRRAFTLIELVLAMSLGAIVVVSTFAIFGMINRADKLQSQRLDRAQELAVAHLVMSRAFTTLLMSDEQLPPDEKLKERILEDAASAGEDRAALPEPTGKNYRFALQPSTSGTDADGRPIQILDVTLRTPPIIGGLREAGDSQTGLTAEEIEVLRRQAQAGNTPGANRSGPSVRLLAGLVNADSSDALSTRLLSETVRIDEQRDQLDDPTPTGLLPARAPGLRGRFELRPPTAPENARPDDAPPEGLELWWMQYPPGMIPESQAVGPSSADAATPDAATRDENDDAGNINERRAQARVASGPVREIRLISGLRSATWRVYRQKKFVSKMRAAFDRELPAYVEFDFVTNDGRDEKWAFEVAWTSGQEPGSLLKSNQAPLAADALGSGNPAGGESTLLDDKGQPVVDSSGQPIKVTVGPDGKPSVNGNDPSVFVTVDRDGQPVVTVNGQKVTVSPPKADKMPITPTGSPTGSTTTGAGGNQNFTREQIMEMVRRRLAEGR